MKKLAIPTSYNVRRGTKYHAAVLELARTDPALGDDLEIDNDAKVSLGDDNGAFVQAWLWVSFVDDPQLDRDE